MADEELGDLTDEEVMELRGLMNDFRRAIETGAWVGDAKKEAKRRVSERRQAALRDDYDAEVASLQHVEERLRLRDKYRKLGLKI